MAGLQQYNFFPTDLFYPRPHPAPSSVKSVSVNPTVLPLQNPNLEISEDLQRQQQQKKKPQHPSKYALVSDRKDQSVSMSNVERKQSKFSINPLSLMALIPDDDDSDSY